MSDFFHSIFNFSSNIPSTKSSTVGGQHLIEEREAERNLGPYTESQKLESEKKETEKENRRVKGRISIKNMRTWEVMTKNT